MNTLEAMECRLAALYEVDVRGRISRVAAHTEAERAAGEAPRFHLARTPLGNVWRFRSDLSAAVVKRLATLAGKEAALVSRNPEELPDAPEREEFMRRALEEAAPVESFWAGPVYAFPEALESELHSHEVREWREADVPLHAELADAAFTPGGWAVVFGARAMCGGTMRPTSHRTQAGTALATHDFASLWHWLHLPASLPVAIPALIPS